MIIEGEHRPTLRPSSESQATQDLPAPFDAIMGPGAARPVRPEKTIAEAAENGRDGRHEKRPAFRPILISGENGFHRPRSEERLRPVTKTIIFVPAQGVIP